MYLEVPSTRNRRLLNMRDYIQKKYATIFLKPYLTWYLKKERITHLRGFKLTVKPTVFHPKYFFSTTYLVDFVSRLNLANKTFLEIGCGSGLISLEAYRHKAKVSCCDINEAAIISTTQNLEFNFKSTKPDFYIYKSDVLEAVPKMPFDYIVINPPYFFEDVTSDSQLAWNCGKNGEYFKKLFSQLHGFIHKESQVYMILADNCDIKRIKEIAVMKHFNLSLEEQKKIKWEVNYIFKINHYVAI